MKRINIFACMALGVMLAAGCDKDEPKVVDFPVVGDFSISGKYVTYMHGYQGWVAEDKIGVFVTSDGVEQSNLAYKPSEICPASPNEWVEGYFSYKEADYKDGDILLTAEGTKAGFKQGEHMIYAYVPYTEGNDTHTAVRLPDLTKQEYIPYIGLNYLKFEYAFAYAKLAGPVSEYSSATLSLGEFTSPLVQMTAAPAIENEELENKTITKIVVSADKDIVCKDATINLETGEVTGEMSKSFELVLPKEGLTITKSFFGLSMETIYLSLCIDPKVAMETEFTFTFTIDGKDYTATGKPNEKMSMDGNLNMYNQLSIK